MVYVLALGAALANALTSVLQRIGVEDAPAEDTLRLRLLTHALKRGIWLAGFALMAVSFVCQGVALHFGRLTEVQPLLTAELFFLVLILGTWFHFTVGWREWVGSLVAAVGLSCFLLFSESTRGNTQPTLGNWIITIIACSLVIGGLTMLARKGPRWWRAAMFGSAAAVSYALTAAFTKEVGDFVATNWETVYRHWQTYGLIIFGVLAVFLTQNAYHAGPIAASQSTIVLLDPLVSILIGIALFGDDLRTSGAWGPLEAIALLMLVVGAVILCNSPLVTGIKGDHGHEDELLLRRHAARRPKVSAQR